MPELEIGSYFILFVLLFTAGFIDSIAGGGGLITVPGYIMLGVPAPFVLGTNKTVSTIGTTLSIYRYIRHGKIAFRQFLLAIVFSFLGSLYGASLSHILTEKLMIYIVMLLVPLLLLFEFLKKLKMKKRDNNSVNFDTAFYIKATLIGMTIGFYDGFFGPGTGTFFILALIALLGLDILSASANARILNYSSNIAAFLYFSSQMKVVWAITPVAIIAALAGNYLGSHFVIKGNATLAKLLLYLVLFAIIVKILSSAYL